MNKIGLFDKLAKAYLNGDPTVFPADDPIVGKRWGFIQYLDGVPDVGTPVLQYVGATLYATKLF